MRTRSVPAGLASLLAVFTTMHASRALASGQELCGIYDDGCCIVCTLTECDTGVAHPERRCTTGSMLSSVTVDQAKCGAAGISNGAAYCASLDPRPVGVCIPPDYSSQPEVANGIDDNCDGVYLDDERCDGIDSDGDGRVDEAPGSCLERHLFVPVCWVGGNQQDFTDVVERWERFMQERTLLNHCGIDTGSFGTKKIWYEAADINTIPCPPEWTTSDQVSAWSLLPALKDYYDLRDWDYVSFATRLPASPLCIAGSTASGTGIISLKSDGYQNPYPGEPVVFAHEWGHNIFNDQGQNLGEEYRFDDGPNVVRASLGCDPETCCTGAHCYPPVDGKLCLGNKAKDLTDWEWGDPTPPEFPDGGRCIMSNAGAPGAEVGDPVSGVGLHRGWCQACLNHIEANGPNCEQNYVGPQRRIELAGRVDVTTGKVSLVHSDISEGRMGGGIPKGGDVEIELFDSAGNMIGSFAPKAHSHEPGAEATSIAFLARVPVAPSVNGAIRVVSLKEGSPVAQVTAGGEPAVVVANDIVVECVTALATTATLDGSGSFDPDGDTLSFAWTSSATLTSPNAAITTGSFPLGVSTATLRVDDGTLEADEITVSVTVRDTTGPILQTTPVSAQTCVPAPTSVMLTTPQVLSECSGLDSVAFTAQLVAVRGRTLPTPVSINPVNPQIDLPIGTSTIRWVGMDPSGNTTAVMQEVTVTLVETAAACCEDKSVVLGSSWPDLMLRPFSGEYCMLGLGSSDSITGGPGPDILLGGADSDRLIGGSDADLIFGGAGSDIIKFPLGQGVGYGGDGNDAMEMTGSGTLYGNAGDDTIVGLWGDHHIYPGPGRDTVQAGVGNDVVYVHDTCELTALEVLDGGLGHDTLYLPESLENVIARGVIVLGFEHVVVTTENRHLSECF